MSALAVGQKQLVEIAKALSQNSRVLIMDEPTSALSDAEVDALLGVIRDLIASGVAIVHISHWMDEIFRISGVLTVFRDGRTVALAPTDDVDMAWIHARMLGSRQREALEAAKPSRRRTEGLPLGNHPVFLPAVAIIVIAMVLGASIGAIDGALVAVIRITAFIATLGMLYIAGGAALLITGGASFINLAGNPAKRIRYQT